ncbi:hypothetical protein SUDANB105_07999 [Streptomyces sp. enrichment culture]
MSPSWRSVPIPASAARLPRNSAGRPVPANVTWYEPDDDGSILVARNPNSAHTSPAHVHRDTAHRGSASNAPSGSGSSCSNGSADCAMRQSIQLVFGGETNAQYYLEPPLRQLCAA